LDTFNDCFVEVVERYYKCVTFEGIHVPLISCILSIIVDSPRTLLFCVISFKLESTNLNLKAHIEYMFPHSRGACCVVRTFRASIKIGNLIWGGADFHSITIYGTIFWENLTDTRKVFYTQKENC